MPYRDRRADRHPGRHDPYVGRAVPDVLSAVNSESTAQESDKRMDPLKSLKEIEYDSYIHIPILSYICAEGMKYVPFLET